MSQPAIEHAIRTAQQHHRAGRLAEAEALYRQALQQDPNSAEALHGLGVLAAKVGRLKEATDLVRRATQLRPGWAEAHGNLGNLLNAAGQMNEAVHSFRRAIDLNPKLLGAHSNLGNVYCNLGQFEDAIACFRETLQIDPNFASGYSNMGDALRKMGRLDESIAASRKAIELKGDFPEAYNNLANALMDAGRHEEALTAYRRAIAIRPEYVTGHYNLGIALQQTRRPQEAIASYREAIRLMPRLSDAFNNLGNALAETGQYDEAIGAYRKAIEIRPVDFRAHSNLCNAYREVGRGDEAIASARESIRLKPDFHEPYSNLGCVFRDKGELDESIAAFRQAVALNPAYAEAHNNLGGVLTDKRELEAAIEALRRAIEFRPTFGAAYSNLARTLAALGRTDDAIATYRQAIALDPNNAQTHSNLVFTLQYHPDYDGEKIHQELMRWNDQHARPQEKFIQPHANNREPDRRLRVGYVSPDFREHVVGQNLLPLLREHDHAQFEIYCYASVQRPDGLTEELRRHADVWRSVNGRSDAQLAAQIRADQIDILVELSLHTAANRLVMMAQKPAPVQVSYLGYPGSTGVSAIDYRFSDRHIDPTDSDFPFYSEATVRLPDVYWCYRVPGATPEVSPRPFAASDFVTFGCLNNFAKISDPAKDLWAEILKQTPGSRLLIHSHPGRQTDEMRRRFADHGISPDRLQFVPEQKWADYVKTYERIDIALDTFPWGGGITTCNALWMGVPVVTLIGRTSVGRGGASILSAVGFPELVAQSPEQYVRIAVELSRNPARIGEISATLRPRMQSSPLMDGPSFARHVESIYRRLWRTWTAKNSPSGLQ